MSKKFSFKKSEKSEKSKKFSFKKSKKSEKSKNTVKNEINKKTETILEQLYPNSDLNNKILDYDFDIEDELFFKKTNIKKNKIVNHNLLNKLPSLDCNIDNISIDTESNLTDDENNLVKKINSQINDSNVDTLDLDLDSLEREQVGEKYYYFDYSKGIIYDLKYNSIGYIDEFGEIFIE